MATAKPQPLPPRPRRQPRRRWRTWLVLALLLAVGLLAWFRAPIIGYANAGASYGARVACSCRYIGGRSLDDCRKDFVSGMAMVTLSEDAEAKAVTARFPLIASHTARMRPGLGCVLEKWED